MYFLIVVQLPFFYPRCEMLSRQNTYLLFLKNMIIEHFKLTSDFLNESNILVA